MPYDFSALKQHSAQTQEWLRKEYGGIRTSRATPTLLDAITVPAYGSKLPLTQLASISVLDARTLQIVPYDASQVKEVERVLLGASLGVSVVTDEKGSKVFFPELTSERRETLLKLAREKLGEARVTLRGKREEVWSDIQAKERAGEMSEDEKFRSKEELQKLIDAGNERLEEIFSRKEKEITS